MEANFLRIPLTTAIAPIIWGSTYYLTRNFLPPDYPLTAATLRALPAGLILLTLTRTLPNGSWWLKTFIISTLTISGFFILIYISGSRLPSSIASMVMTLSPIATMLIARIILAERITSQKIYAGLLGIAGVTLLISNTQLHLDPLGLLAAGAAMTCSALGFVLTRYWQPSVNPAVFTSWQLTLGGLTTLPLALAVEGIMPPQPVATNLAFV